MSYRLLQGDCRAVLAAMDAESLDACVTDPPYDLTGAKGSTKGFMGKEWDGTGVAFDVETWRAVYRMLKPGAHLIAFGGTRTYHRMTCAIEDAGFEVRDCIAWAFATGFPKSLNVALAIDKHLGVESADVGTGMSGTTRNVLNAALHPESFGGEFAVRRAVSPEAQAWEGFGTSLKPSYEPAVVARKPLRERSIAAQVLATGTGAIDIDATRVGLSGGTCGSNYEKTGLFGIGGKGDIAAIPAGRWPANLLLVHAEGCEPKGARRVKSDGHHPAMRGENTIYSSLAGPGVERYMGDSEGREPVIDWRCVGPKTVRVPFYAGRFGALSAFDEPEYLLGRLAALLQGLAGNSMGGNALLPDVAASYYNADKGSSGESSAVDGVARVLQLTEALGSLVGCPSCHRFYGGHAHQIVASAQEAAPLLLGALSRAYCALLQHAHSHPGQWHDRPTSSDGLGRPDEREHTRRSNIPPACRTSETLAETAPGNDDTRPPAECSPPECSPRSSTPSPCDSPGTLDHSACRDEAIRLLVLLAFDVSSRSYARDIIARGERAVQFDGCPVRLLGQQSGESASTDRIRNNQARTGAHGIYQDRAAVPTGGFSDEGDASRFFAQFHPYYYVPKASRAERDAGCESLPLQSGADLTDRQEGSDGLNSPRAGAGRTSGGRNTHATVKPVEMIRYLVRLVTPPGGTCLDPFMGSGTTGVACVREERDFVGIELMPEHMAIAEARIKHATAPEPWELPLFADMAPTPAQASLFDAPLPQEAQGPK